VLGKGKGGQPQYFPRESARRKLSGYLRNVALNKVLLTNQRFPFVLATPLHACITIGVDVKHHTAGLVVVGRSGEKLRSFCRTSRQKEKLREEQMEKYLIEIISDEATARREPARVIVIHRDGRVFPSEIAGAKKAIERLRSSGIIAAAATLTILEIAKTPQAPARFFEISEKDGEEIVDNPQIGLYRIVGETEGYLCTTGRAFQRPGTVEPLHVRHIEGPLPLEKCLEDIYCLSALAFTKPDDCARYPVTIKLNDRFLGEEATEYDADALEFDGELAEAEEEVSA
ncbi:MAG TPA: Piwi domain-containing protein, partial [Blastocatellia bacterium]|nr:Piwi domain-containing protein [Blastocatellia bacterium]